MSEEKEYSTHDYIGELTDDQRSRCESVRERCKELENLLMGFPSFGSRSFSSRCIAESRTCLEAASQMAIKSIVFEGKKVKGY